MGETREATVFEGYRVKGGLSWSCGGLDESASLTAMGSSGGLGSACGGNMLEERKVYDFVIILICQHERIDFIRFFFLLFAIRRF